MNKRITFPSLSCNLLYYLSPQEKNFDHVPKKPKIADDYAAYSDVFPDTKTIANHNKNSQALQREQGAAIALINKGSNSKAILHFDTNKRSRIECEWPPLTLNIRSPPNQTQRFTLRPLFFAFEDRENVAKLMVETLLDFRSQVVLHQKYYGN